MNKKNIKILKLLMTFIVIVLVVELVYIVYLFFFTKDNNIYFDGTNSFIYNNKSEYVAVGSNNDNDKYYEKGKITIYDKDLNKVTEKLYNKGYKSAFLDIVEDDDGYVVVGSYEKSKNDNENNIRRALIVKYDLEGNILFEKDFRDAINSSFTGIIKEEDGYVAVGYSISDTNKDGGAYIIKYDKTGNIIWKSNYGDKSNAKFKDLIKVDDYYYVVGIDKKNISVLCKFDNNGKLIKDSIYKYTDNLGFTGIVYYNDYLYITGNRKAKGEENSLGNALLVKYSTDLKRKKEVVYSNDKASRYNTLDIDNNNIIVIGTINENKQYDGLIGKYDSDLNVIVTKELGSSSDTYFNDIIIVDGKYRVIGYSSYNKNYLTKFITFSDALRILESK